MQPRASWMRGCLFAAGLMMAVGMPPVAAAQDFAAVGDRQMVFPFEDATGSPTLYWLSEASAVLLSDDLGSLGAAALSREDRLLAFEQLRVPSGAVLSHATAIRIGALLGVSQVVVGSYRVAGDELTVSARAIRLDSGRLLPEIVETAPLSDIFQIYGRLARRLLPDSQVPLEAMEQGWPPVAAFEQYIKGLLAQSAGARVSFFSQALRLAPAFQRVRLGLWDVYSAQGEYQRALSMVRQVPEEHRLYRRASFLASLSMLDLAQYGAAADLMAELHRQRPDASLVNNLGVVQIRRPAGGSLVRASSFFVEATRADPTDADLFFNLGYAYWREGELPDAIDALREVVRRDPADADAHVVLAAALERSGASPEAARERELARQLSSSYAAWEARPDGLTTVPVGLERLKTTLDVPAALRVDDAIVAAGQRDQREQAVFHLENGKRLVQAERDVEAIAELRRAVYLAPYQSEAHLTLGRAYFRLGRLEEALNALRISVWSADTVAARLLMAELHVQTGDTAAAREQLDEVARRDPGNIELRRLRERAP